MIDVTSLDHLGLTVSDLTASIDFYIRVLDMEVITFGDDQTLAFGHPQTSFYVAGHEIEPKARRPVAGSAGFGFLLLGSLE